MSEQSIYTVDGEAEAMRVATENARKSFKFLWRELSWEYRRIVPGLDLAAVKVGFANDSPGEGEPPVEHMWVSDIQFDGTVISGVLLNEPHWVRGLGAGDAVSTPLAEITDWMCAVDGKVYGGYTIDVMRAGMSKAERQQHDQAWGLDFGKPGEVWPVPSRARTSKGFLSGLLSGKGAGSPVADPELTEHPMSENMASKIEEALVDNPSLAFHLDESGWSMLHREALAGNSTPVAILLRHGADPKALNGQGLSALDLARKMGWPRIVALLEGH